MATLTRCLARSLPAFSSLISRSTPSLSLSTASCSTFSLLRLRPLSAAAVSVLRHLPQSTSARSFSTRQTSSSLNDPNPNWSNRPPKETILLDGCDFEHWLVVMEKPEGDPTRDEIIDSYIKTLAMIVGSEEEARMKIYSVSTRCYFAFGALVSEELSLKIKELPRVRWVLPDSYLDVKNKDYGEWLLLSCLLFVTSPICYVLKGHEKQKVRIVLSTPVHGGFPTFPVRTPWEPFIDGKAVPYDPKYHEEWIRNNARANERNRRNDRPRNFDRSRNFERRRENMQNRDFQAPMQNSPPNMVEGLHQTWVEGHLQTWVGGPPPNMGGGPPPNMGGGPPPNMGGGPPPNMAWVEDHRSNNFGGPQNNFRGGPPNNYGGAPPSNYGGGAPPSNYGGGAPPGNYGGGAPPSNYGGGTPPSNIGGGAPPSNYGGGAPPSNYGGGAPPSNYGGGAPPSNYGGGAPPNNYGGGMPQSNFGGGMPPNNAGGNASQQQWWNADQQPGRNSQ
ncbi:Multiple organellar RNA editing factor 8, chloroplastic/mitochondrial [Vitis vinifera]|uniref:Multiple organellar RNA editing factor 8, chloroplastic/mitochondrial n=1 Tax=Vitis vinifera TaxID=29760 RepID=A0A438E5L4_VITVI|nr:Multiple organellar RNA editing factor 8, chloroplastic/mitochondrial [Vitis vinifera]